MADKQYAPPTSPPPNYIQPKPQEHHDAGPYMPPTIGSPAPGPYNQMAMPNNESGMRAPDPAYGGYYNNNPQGMQGPPAQGYYGPGMNQGGYYGQPGPMPPQGMYYQQQPPPGGYYYEDRRGGGGMGSGVCAGIMGALACCCCLDILF